jgi:hypothetical protein
MQMNLTKPIEGGRVNGLKHIHAYLLVCSLAVILQPLHGFAQQNSAPPNQRDGQHDFDFELGNGKTHISRLQHPLTGSTTWIQMNGTKVVKKVWDGRALLEEIQADGPMGHFEGLTLFLYNPRTHKWSMNFATSSGGTLSVPAVGEFKNERGEFFDQEPLNGRSILVRIVYADISPDSHHFEQAFSDDGGKTWEPNFIATLTRQKD